MTDFAPEILPYLQPGYWDGHMLGDGDGVPNVSTLADGSWLSHRTQLKTALEAMRSIFPLETYRSGDSFSAADYNPGTVLLYRREGLTGDAAVIRTIPEQGLVDDEVPARPLDLPTRFYADFDRPINFSRHRAALATEKSWEPNIRHRDTAYWGITVPLRKGRTGIARIADTLVVKGPQGVGLLQGMLLVEKPNFTIGETLHSTNSRDGHEFLDRVNILHVISYGVTERKKSWSLGKLLKSVKPVAQS